MISASTQTVPAVAEKPKAKKTLWIGLSVAVVAVVAVVVAVLMLSRGSMPIQPLPPATQVPAQPKPGEAVQQPNVPLPDLAPLQRQFMRANELLSQDKLDQAREEFLQVAENSKQLLEQRPDWPQELQAELHALAGQSWLALKQPDRAQPHFEELTRLAPRNAEALVGVALAHMLRDRLEAANEALDRALRLNPDLNSAHLLKACTLIKQNERLPALREFRQAGGAETLSKMPPWMRPVLNHIDCAPVRFK
jgi:hypothetical protein